MAPRVDRGDLWLRCTVFFRLTEHLALDIRARYRWKERVSLTARYYHEDYGSADWALDGVGQAAARNLISFGRTSPDYSNGLVSVSVETRL